MLLSVVVMTIDHVEAIPYENMDGVLLIDEYAHYFPEKKIKKYLSLNDFNFKAYPRAVWEISDHSDIHLSFQKPIKTSFSSFNQRTKTKGVYFEFLFQF